MVILKADGSVVPIITSGGIPSLNYAANPCAGDNETLTAEQTPVSDPNIAASYYLDDHLGTTQMELSSGGWPVWSGAFTPFGQEIINGTTTNYIGAQPADGTAMRYKFTGKERDAESGLDYFGARYLSSSMGRWMSPDWADKPVPVPYADLEYPQSLNLYAYVENNPLSRLDADGHQKSGSNYKDMGKGWTMRTDTRSTDRVNIHLEKGGQSYKYILEDGKLTLANGQKGGAPNWLVEKATGRLESTGKFEMAANKGTPGAAAAEASILEDIGGKAFGIMNFLHIGFQVAGAKADLEKNGYTEIAGMTFISDLNKVAASGINQINFDGDTFNLHNGSFVDSKGYTLMQDTKTGKLYKGQTG
jgi:RHS repeat-associated protein